MESLESLESESVFAERLKKHQECKIRRINQKEKRNHTKNVCNVEVVKYKVETEFLKIMQRNARAE